MRLAWIALGIAMGLALGGGVIALEQIVAPAAAPRGAPDPGAHGMTPTEQCQHMPEHCAP